MPCEWPVPEPTCDAYTRLNPEMRSRVLRMAVDYLDRWTGQVFGLCPTTVRPCDPYCTSSGSTYHGGGPTSYMGRGSGCSSTCGWDCTPQQIRLPSNAHSVSRVVIDGAVLDASKYRVDNGVFLVRTDGGSWPQSQDWVSESGTLGVWEVTYLTGTEVPDGGLVAAATLACEFAKAMTQDPTCQLPKRVTSISRQDVTVTMLDSFDDIEKGHTGIWLVDSWVASVTAAPASRPGVISPDRMGRTRRTTWRSS